VDTVITRVTRRNARLLAAAWAAALLAPPLSPVSAQPNPPEAADPNVQVLTRGPIHEAFAEPVVYDPKAGPVVPKQPPPPVQEVPPDQQPAGSDVQWIPGYWAWDDGRNDFLWVSGFWRDVPPGRHWVPGYWDQVAGGFQWVPGYWAPDAVQSVQYLPAPPESLESGPSSPAPGPDYTWAPGYWDWQGGQYVWRPGSWIPGQRDWVWVPTHSMWTPSGYVSVPGYWDLPIAQRGQLFAPVYFRQPVYTQRNFLYTPTVGLIGSSLLTSLFVRPAYGSYYFGDYYGANSFQSGIYPWYSYHQSRYGYDPLYAHYAAVNAAKNPHWLDEMHAHYQYMREHPDARPPHTYGETLAFERRLASNADARARSAVLARPLHQIASAPKAPVRFERVNEERRQALARQAAEVQQYREQRARRQAQAGRIEAAKAFKPREVTHPRSPIAGAAPHRTPAPPATPPVPRPDPDRRPPAPGHAPARFEPHPTNLPPERFRPNFRPAPTPERGRPPR
jgi:hypothetical protein